MLCLLLAGWAACHAIGLLVGCTSDGPGADGNGKVYPWLYKITRILQYPMSNAILSVAYSPDDSHLAVASASGKVYVELVNS